MNDYLETKTECEKTFAYLHTIAAIRSYWEENDVPENNRELDYPEAEAWLKYFQMLDGEEQYPDIDDFLEHRDLFDKEARDRLGDSRFSLDEITVARVLEGIIRLNQTDPCEGGNMLTKDMGCTLARAIVLRKYCVEYDLVYHEDASDAETCD